MNRNIVFIILYMGQYPWYFPYFLHSCRFNSTVDFIILSDNESAPVELPSNVKLIHYTMDQFKSDASKSLGFNIVADHGYKLCDFKPTYGYIFSDLVKGYDFWGHCDMDIIFGNIRNFMTDEILNEYDVISARHDYLTGSFALYRNRSKFNQLFMQSKDYRKVYTTPRNFCFDETNYAFIAFEKGLHYSKIRTEVESMTHVVKKLQEEGKLKAYFEFQILEGLAGNMLWENGTLIYRRKFEAMYYHLIKMKTIYKEDIDINQTIPSKFRIGKKKIYYKR